MPRRRGRFRLSLRPASLGLTADCEHHSPPAPREPQVLTEQLPTRGVRPGREALCPPRRTAPTEPRGFLGVRVKVRRATVMAPRCAWTRIRQVRVTNTMAVGSNGTYTLRGTEPPRKPYFPKGVFQEGDRMGADTPESPSGPRGNFSA